MSSLKELEDELLSLRSLMSYFEQTKEMMEETRSLTASFLDLKDNTELLYLSSEKIYSDLQNSNLKGLHDEIASLTDQLKTFISKNRELLINKFEISEQSQSVITTVLYKINEQTESLRTESLGLKNDLNNEIRIIESNFYEMNSLLNSTKEEVSKSQKNILDQIEFTRSNYLDSLNSISLSLNSNLKNGLEVSERISVEMNLSFDLIKDRINSVEKGISEQSEAMGSRLFHSFETLYNAFEGLELPKRLAKIDEVLFTIQQSIINNQSRIESIERNIKDEINFRTSSLKNEFTSILKEEVLKSEKGIQLLIEKLDNYKNETHKMIEDKEYETRKILKNYFSLFLVSLAIIVTLVIYIIAKG